MILLYFKINLKEQFSNNYYLSKKLQNNIPNRPIMEFLGDLKKNYDEDLYSRAQDYGSGFHKQKLLCNYKIRKDIENKAVDKSFSKLNEPNYNNCIDKATYLCEFTKPEMYLSDNKYFQPRWTFKPYKDQAIPKATDLNCWNRIHDCCYKNKN